MNDNPAPAITDAVAQDEPAPPLIIPVIDHAGQGGLGHKDLYDPAVPVTLQAHSSHCYSDDTFIELYWDDQVVQHFSMGPPPRPDVLGFKVLPAHIHEPRGETWYTAYDPLSGHRQSSPRRTVPVKLSVPGDPDPDNTTPYLNEHLSPPGGVAPEIDQARDLTLNIAPWPHMHEGDVLTLYWGSSRHAVRNPPLTAGQPGKAQTVVVSAALQLAAGANDRLQVNYDIRDVVGNWSLYSVPAFSKVDIDPTAPAPPVIREADPDSGELSLADLGEQNVHVQVPVYAGIAEGDRIVLHWLGQSGAEPVEPDLPPLQVDDPQFPPLFVVPNAVAVAIADGTAVLYYDVQPVSGAPRTSRHNTLLVRGYPLALIPASVDNSARLWLDPLKAIDGATVRVRYAHMNPGQQIGVSWNAQAIAEPPEQPGDTQGEVSFLIPPARLGATLGKNIEVAYQVTRQGRRQDSEPLPLMILGFPDSDTAQVQGPKILQAPDNRNLDVSRLSEDPDLIVPPWPFIASGQRIWLHMEGKLADGSFYLWRHPQWQDHPIAAPHEQRTHIPLSELRTLKDGSTLRLVLAVSFDGGQSQVELPARLLTLSLVAAVNGYQSWEAADTGFLPAGETVEFSNRLKVTSSRGTAGIVSRSRYYPAFGDRGLQAGATDRVRFDFDGLIRSLYLAHLGAMPGHNQLIFHDRAGEPVHSASMDSQERIVQEHIVFEQPCAGFEMVLEHNIYGFWLDNLIWSALPTPGAAQQTGEALPVIWRVFDAEDRYLPDGSVTDSTTLRLEGTGKAGSVMRLYDGNALVMSASVTLEAAWAILLDDLGAGEHTFGVQAPDNSLSPLWHIQVAAPLTIDNSPMELKGLFIKAPQSWPRSTLDAPGNVGSRTASGGIPPYAYSSSDPAIASVDSQGKVTGNANGQALISVRDSRERVASYNVTVSNVWRLEINEGPLNFAQANAWMSSLPGRRLGLKEGSQLVRWYVKPWPLPEHYWFCSSGPNGTYNFYNRGQYEVMMANASNTSIRGAWYLVAT